MKLNILLILLAILLIAPNFIDVDINKDKAANLTSPHSPMALNSVTDINTLEKYIDLAAAKYNLKPGDPGYLLFASHIVSHRFTHGFSHWNLSQNWIASLGQRITGIGLACKVQPDGMMKDRIAACSQQAQILMEIFKRKGINYQKVGFPHHYALQAESNGKWYYLDSDNAPNMSLQQREFASWKGMSANLKPYYLTKIGNSNFNYHFGDDSQIAELGTINEIPARNLTAFQNITALLSKGLFMIPLLIVYYRRGKFVVSAAAPESRPYTPPFNVMPA